MKTLKVLIIIAAFGFMQSGHAQFWEELEKRAAEAAKETINRKVENKTADKTGEGMDAILNSDKKQEKIGKKEEKNNPKKKNKKSSENEAADSERTVNSNMDFESGYHAIFTDTFKNDAIGDFPVTWNTNSSGEVVTFDKGETKWLQLDVGEYTLDGITEIPENCTFEFDLTVSDNFDYYSGGIKVNIIAVKDRRKDFMQWSSLERRGTDGIRLRLKPKNFEYKGETGIETIIDNKVIVNNTKNNNLFTMENSTVHVALWRQKTRLRVYLNNQKVWDLPRAFGNVNYNAISFNTVGEEKEHFYVSNLRLAKAGEDTRHPLLETGRFETSDILFDVNKASIQPSSFNILDDLGKVLQENPTVRIQIIGHTDSDGSAEANVSLSKERAQAIKNYLSNNFPIAGNRMQIVGKGESEPIESNATPKGKAKNRRVEFVRNK